MYAHVQRSTKETIIERFPSRETLGSRTVRIRVPGARGRVGIHCRTEGDREEPTAVIGE